MLLMVGLRSNGGMANLLHGAAPATAAGGVDDGSVLLLALLEFSLASLILLLQLLL